MQASRPARTASVAKAVAELPPQLSVVIPVYNEEGNLGPLMDEIEAALGGRLRYEVVVVDDGSSDGTGVELAAFGSERSRLRVVHHDRNRGQSAAIHSGVHASAAPVIAVLDGDGQNDPADIPSMFGRLKCVPQLRMVVGERRVRHDGPVRCWSSRVANAVRSRILRDGIRDTGCGMKVFYRDDFLALPAFDHMHRFLPALIQRQGGRVLSIPVNHRPRRIGVSKYGIGNRLWVGITDMLGVVWLNKRAL